jgi:superfamily II DNA or RNA helicase
MERQRQDQEQYAAYVQILPEDLTAMMSPDEFAIAHRRYTQMHIAIEPLKTRAPKRFLEQGEPISYQMAEALARRSYLGATPQELAREIYGSDEREFVSQIRSRLSRLQYSLVDIGSRMTIDVLPEVKEDEKKKEERWYLRYRSEEPLSRISYLYQKGKTLSDLDKQDEIHAIDQESDLTKQIEIREPYPYQRECLQELRKARSEGKKRALVVMATGTGKTAVAAFDTKQAIGGFDTPRVLYICHQSDILTRAQKTFAEVLGDEYTYGFYDGKRKSDIKSTNFMFATFQTLGINIHKFPSDYFDYIVVDESHHSHAATYRPVVEHFAPRFMLGITATPDRADLQDIRELFGEEVYSLSLERALAQGLLSKIDYRVMSANIDSEKIAKLKQHQDRDVTIALLDRELFQPMALDEVVEKIKEKIKEVANPHVMIFTPNVDECEKVAGMMEGAVAVHSKMNDDRGDVVKALQKGEIDTAVAVDVFNEGIDIPQTNVLVFLRSTSSKTIFYQQLGRGLRKVEGKDQVLVLDFVGNCERIRMIQELAEGVKREGGELRTGHARMRGEVDDIGDLDFEEISIDVLNLLSVATANNSQPGEGWFTANHLSSEFGKDDGVVGSIVAPFRETHPEWFSKYNLPGGVSELFSPQLCQIVRERLDLRVQIEERCTTSYKLAKQVGRSIKLVNKVISGYRETNPEWFFDIKKGQMLTTYIDPVLAEIVVNTIGRVEPVFKAEEGWLTSHALANELGITDITLRKIARKYKESFPEWFRDLAAPSGHVREYYSPDLIKQLSVDVAILLDIPPVPSGWLTYKGVAKLIHKNEYRIKEVAERILQKEPHNIRRFRNEKNGIYEYCSPELIEAIQRELS